MGAVSLLFHDVYVRDTRESGFVSDAADRYKLPLAAFEAQLAGLVAARGAARGLHGTAAHRANFEITVDDGGVSYYTVIADRLEARGWRGLCFVSTDFIGQPGFLDPGQIRELHARDHVIGSHSASHPARMSACGAAQLRDEWQRSRERLEDLLGAPVTVASVPGGYYSRGVARAARDAGLRVLYTSEPTTRKAEVDGLTVHGRFTIRRGDDPRAAQRLVMPAPWARGAAWASWNAKGLVKPLLGPAYARIADWLLTSGVRPHSQADSTP